jgi:hypothetical protein
MQFEVYCLQEDWGMGAEYFSAGYEDTGIRQRGYINARKLGLNFEKIRPLLSASVDIFMCRIVRFKCAFY